MTQWNPAKAFGWIEADGGGQFFAHKSEFVPEFPDGPGPPQGSPVTFEIGVDSKSGKERAQSIQLLNGVPSGGKGPGRQVARPSHGKYRNTGTPRLHGVVNSWNAAKACGWLDCMEYPGQSIFAHKSEFAEQFGDVELPAGTPVSFLVGTDAKSGKERATNIQFAHQFGYSPARTMALPMRASSRPSRVSGARRLTGALTEWNSARACGWIECKKAPGGRLFAHKSEFIEQFDDNDEPPPGLVLSFVQGIDNVSGKTRACSIRISETGLDEAGGDLEQTPLQGYLTAWNQSKACGWVEADSEPGTTYFAHKSEFLDTFDDGDPPAPGTQVMFVVGIDEKSGKERAQQIQLFRGQKRALHNGGEGGPVAKATKKFAT